MSLLILFPDRRSELEIPEKAIEGVKQFAQARRADDTFWAYSLPMANLAALLPERKYEFMPEGAGFELIRTKMAEAREVGAILHSGYCRSLAILSADETRITDRGVEIVFRDDMQQADELPVRKIA